jgi:hypothetical protein
MSGNRVGSLSITTNPSNQPTPVVGPLTDAELRETPVKVDDDETQVLLSTLNSKDFATAIRQDQQIAALNTLINTTDSINAKDFATSAKQDTQITLSTSANTKLDTLHADEILVLAQLTSINSKLSTPMPVLVQNALVKVPYDQVQITAVNANNDPTTILFKLATVTQKTMTITYDGLGDVSNVVVV